MITLLCQFYDVILYLGSVQVKIVENPNFVGFHPICLKFGIGGNFEMLVTKGKPKLKLENDLKKTIQFCTDFSQNFTKHSSTIAFHRSSGCQMELVCIQN